MLFKTLFTGFAPNMDKQDIAIAMAYLLLPWKWGSWRKGAAVARVESSLADYLDANDVIAYDSGRTALYGALKALDIGPGDEVIVQAFTCVVVINAITWTGATPVYVDIQDDYNTSLAQIKEATTENTCAIIIQHTFGTPANVEAITAYAKEHSIATVEDCAHSLGAAVDGKKVGTFADIGIFSFGSDKVISSVRGGAASTQNANLAVRLREYQASLPQTTRTKVFQHLLQYPIFYLGKKTYHLGIGKLCLALAKKLHISYRFVYSEEKQGKMVPFFPSKLPQALAHIAVHQIDAIDQKNAHRQSIAALYRSQLHNKNGMIKDEQSIMLRYPLLVDDPHVIKKRAKQSHIILGNWYNNVIAPADIDMTATGYQSGSCPKAEEIAARIINLPTNQFIDEASAAIIANIVNE